MYEGTIKIRKTGQEWTNELKIISIWKFGDGEIAAIY